MKRHLCAASLIALVSLALLPGGARADRTQEITGGGHQNGAPQNPRAQKEQALARLEQARDGIADGTFVVGDPEEAVEELEDAIEELEESLDPELWAQDAQGNIDGERLDPEEGSEVFHEERECVEEIFEAIDEGEIDGDPRSELLDIVDALVAADRQLAEVAIEDAQDGGGDQDEIDEALASFAKGDAFVDAAAGQTDLELKSRLLGKAMDGAYRHAWEEAIEALDLDD